MYSGDTFSFLGISYTLQMDLQTLSNLFATTYNPDPNVRKAAELQIRKVISHLH
jgi:hypothetical protein